MGTLSGGGTQVISIGERCLLGANSGIGISLGDDCVVEAGCYVTAGTKVTTTDMDGKPKVIKAARALRARPTSCSGATRSPARSRQSRGRPGHRAQRRPACELGRVRLDAWSSRLGHAHPRGRRRRRLRDAAAGGRPDPGPRGMQRGGGRRRVTCPTEQAENAALIAAIGVRRGLPARAVSIALATAYQESKIENLPDGDRDSLGIFQQRPSMGWGTADRSSDPYYAINKFYDELDEGRRLRDDADHRGRPGGPAFRLPRGLRGPRRPTPGRWPRR